MATIQMVFSARLVDVNGRARACTAYYSRADTTTLAQLITALEGFAADVIGMTDAGIKNLSATIEDAGYITDSIGDSPIEQTGVLNFYNTVNNRRWGFAIPALGSRVLVGDRINLLDADVELVLAEFTAGSFTNDHAQPLSALADAFVSFRKDRKQLQRSSLETA